jgi:superfamily II DNA or RNA helicase
MLIFDEVHLVSDTAKVLRTIFEIAVEDPNKALLGLTAIDEKHPKYNMDTPNIIHRKYLLPLYTAMISPISLTVSNSEQYPIPRLVINRLANSSSLANTSISLDTSFISLSKDLIRCRYPFIL